MIRESARPSTPARAGGDRGPLPPDDDAGRPTIRRVATLAEYLECVAVQRETWGADFTEYVPATILQITHKLGGVVAGAFAADGRLLGFVFGMAGVMDGRLVHWSDMLAVRAEARGAHLGERLKRFQREQARATGAAAMYWTFDPLVARNAHLNLARLGARVVEYVPNMYGDRTGSPLHGNLPTDRLVVEWDLAAPGDEAHDAASDAASDAPPSDTPVVRIAVPRDHEALLPASRADWRAKTRDAFLAHLGQGYAVVGFCRGGADELPYYELKRAP